MNRAYDTSRKRPLKTQYLILYNFISAILWLAVFSRVVILLPIVGHKNVYGGVGEFAKWTQTVALLEVLHSASGIRLLEIASFFLLTPPPNTHTHFPQFDAIEMRGGIDLFC